MAESTRTTGTRRKAARRNAILDTAIGVLNDAGSSGTTLEQVAGELGLVRTAVYYYFTNKQDLLLACYRETCDRRDALLADAAGRDGQALDRLRHYLVADLGKARGPMADLQPIAELSARQRGVIVRRSARQVETIAALLDAGMADGSIRVCNAGVVAEVLLSLCNLWAAPQRTGIASTLQGPDSTALVVDMLVQGVIADEHRAVIDGAAPDPARFALPDLSAGTPYLKRRERLLQSALQEFNRSGFETTTLERIAAAVGVSKGMVYHYADSKESLLFQCYDRALRAMERAEQAAVSLGGDLPTVMRRVSRFSIGIHASAAGPLPDYASLVALDQRDRSFLQLRQWELASHYIARLEQGIASGFLKRYEPRLMSTIASAALQGIPRWYQAERHGALDRVEDDLYRTLTLGLRA